MIAYMIWYYVNLGLWFDIQLLCCCGVFAYRFPRRKYFFLRLFVSILIFFSISVGACSVFLVNVQSIGTTWYLNFFVLQLLYFGLIWGLLLCCLVFCFAIGWKESVFIGIGSYAAQHITYSLSTFIRYFITVPSENYGYTVLFETVPLAVVCLLVWLLLTRKRTLRMRRRELRFLPLAGIMIASCIVFSSLSSTARSEEALFMSQIVGRGYAIICCVLILVLLFGFTRENELEQDKQTMEILLHAEQEQHRINRETIDIINIKCHDLKHLLSGLREMDQKPERDEAIAEIQQAVQFYDSNIRTGNDTLDLILTQKSFLCYNKKIALECFIDGTCMVFMKSSDFLSLFGNILDNAIEAVQNFPTEKRTISLRIGERNGSIFIHAENPCGELRFRDGLPQTTKADKAYHGFGVRSIRYIVKKYGGEVSMYTEGGKFHVDILFYSGAGDGKQEARAVPGSHAFLSHKK